MNNTQTLPRTDPNNPEPDLIPTACVIEGFNKLDDWLEQREIVVEELCPVGALKTLYTERAALYLRRLDRVIGYENVAKIGEIGVGKSERFDQSEDALMQSVISDRLMLQTIINYEAHLVRSLSCTMTELRRLQKNRRQVLRESIPGGGDDDRAGVCKHQQIKDGLPGGSPTHKSS